MLRAGDSQNRQVGIARVGQVTDLPIAGRRPVPEVSTFPPGQDEVSVAAVGQVSDLPITGRRPAPLSTHVFPCVGRTPSSAWDAAVLTKNAPPKPARGPAAVQGHRPTPYLRTGVLSRLRWLAFALPFAGALAFAPAQISPQTYLAEVKYLASPELKGRATGSPELEKAAGYISGLFKSFGLKPVSGADYEQPFMVTVNAHLGPDNHLNADDAGTKVVSGRQARLRSVQLFVLGQVVGPSGVCGLRHYRRESAL